MDSSIIYHALDRLHDPAFRALVRNDCRMRTYQSDSLRTIYSAVINGSGGRFTVTFPRQSGKNETQAQLESAVMAANLYRGGNIIKILPTLKNQGKISHDRLEKVTRGAAGSRHLRTRSHEITYGDTGVRWLSAGPNTAIVGATADLMLEADEAQLIPPDKYDREAAPMAASVNAVQVFWGTVWDDQTLLSRETRSARKEEGKSGAKHVFCTTAAEVGQEVPPYADFVRDSIQRFGREHPAIRTQFFCEEISDLTAMFTPARIEMMKGTHDPRNGPEADHCYIFLVDIAGSDEITPASRRANGFSDRRDATVVTICDVTLPEDKAYAPKNFVWNVVARRLYRNLPADRLELEICREVECWDPRKIILDHSGLGAMLSGVLSARYPHKCRPVDITVTNKTKMAWDFLAMVDTGRWREYRSDEMEIMRSGFVPGKEPYEILKDPALLQQMYFRELRACRIEPIGTTMSVRWGVRDGTRDIATGRLIHDDLVMSAAMAVFEEGDLPIGRAVPEWTPSAVFAPLKW